MNYEDFCHIATLCTEQIGPKWSRSREAITVCYSMTSSMRFANSRQTEIPMYKSAAHSLDRLVKVLRFRTFVWASSLLCFSLANMNLIVGCLLHCIGLCRWMATMPGGWLQCISKTVIIGIGGHVEILRECSLDECNTFCECLWMLFQLLIWYIFECPFPSRCLIFDRLRFVRELLWLFVFVCSSFAWRCRC